MAKVVRVKKKPEPAKDSGNKIQKTFEFKHGFMLGLGDDYRDVTWEEMQARIRKALAAEFPGGLFTPVGGHILINGRACYPHDFDYGTMDRKLGTRPPLYTLTKEEQDAIRVEERIERESKYTNHLAKNPTHLLTSRETTELNRLRQNASKTAAPAAKPAVKKTASKPVEWTEDDIDNEEVAVEETKRIVRKVAVKKQVPVLAKKKVVVRKSRG